MITFVTEHLPSLATIPASSPTQAAFAEVLTTCLSNIRVEVMSAPTLADAVAELLQNSLAPALLPALEDLSHNLNLGPQHAQHGTETVDSQHGSHQHASEQLLGCLLRLYSNAVDLYGQCAATQMQITPLLGQGTGLSTQQSPAAEPTGELNTATDMSACLIYHGTCRQHRMHSWSAGLAPVTEHVHRVVQQK